MPDIEITHPFYVSRQEAREIVMGLGSDGAGLSFKVKWVKHYIALVETRGFSGRLLIYPDRVTVVGDLGLAAKLFRGRVVNGIKEKMAALFSPPPRRRQRQRGNDGTQEQSGLRRRVRRAPKQQTRGRTYE